MLATTRDAPSGAMPETPPGIMPGAPPQETDKATRTQTQHYDVCFFLNRRRVLHALDRGIALGADGLSCTANGAAGAELFANIAAVHLQSSGGKTNTESCAIMFADGNVLTALNCNRGGYNDAAFAANYRALVHDLHARLAAAPGSIRFTEGWPLWRCQLMFVVAVGMALISVALGLSEFLRLRDLRGFALVALGGYAGWRFYRVALNNLPRDYTPDHLPEFLLS